jgi:hypothetical protein
MEGRMMDIEVNVEALKLARRMVKEIMRRNGGRISLVTPSGITAAAHELLADSIKGQVLREAAVEICELRAKVVREMGNV